MRPDAAQRKALCHDDCVGVREASMILGLGVTQTQALLDAGAVPGHRIRRGTIEYRRYNKGALEARAARAWMSPSSSVPPEGEASPSMVEGADPAIQTARLRATIDVLLDALVRESEEAVRAAVNRRKTIEALTQIIRAFDTAQPATLPAGLEDALRSLLASESAG